MSELIMPGEEPAPDQEHGTFMVPIGNGIDGAPGEPGDGWNGPQYQYFILYQPMDVGPAQELNPAGMDGFDLVAVQPGQIQTRVAGPNGRPGQIQVFMCLMKRKIRDQIGPIQDEDEPDGD